MMNRFTCANRTVETRGGRGYRDWFNARWTRRSPVASKALSSSTRAGGLSSNWSGNPFVEGALYRHSSAVPTHKSGMNMEFSICPILNVSAHPFVRLHTLNINLAG